jgi:hypothetical protein
LESFTVLLARILLMVIGESDITNTMRIQLLLPLRHAPCRHQIAPMVLL